MENIVISTLLCNILVACTCVMILSWAAVGIHTLITDHKDEKRKEKKEAQDDEYHVKRMEAYK